MVYQGSKRRIAGEILPIMLGKMEVGQTFVDAFSGGSNVVCLMPEEYQRIANDKNRYLIAMWKRLTTTDWKPPTFIPKNFYDEVRNSWHRGDRKFDDATIGWVGFMASRNGRFFDGGYSGHNAKGRDYISENIRNITRQIDSLKGVEWQCGSYDKMAIPEGSLIYCDPPYKGTTGYTSARNFDYDGFYDWARQKKRDGHTVFISEYDIPCGDFQCVWQKQITNSLNITKTLRPTERLYTL